MSNHPPGPSAVVRGMIDEVLNGRDLAAIDRYYGRELAPEAREWIAPFQQSFPDMHMETRELVVAGERVVGRFACSGTHLGEWMGYPATGRRFEQVDEVYFFRVVDGRIVHAWGIEDTLGRLAQLGLVQVPG